MADKTTNYNLIKPTPDDFYDIEVFNENADIIDAELKNLKNTIENLNADGITLPDGKTISEKFEEITEEVGNIQELNTDEKANIVAAINEIYQEIVAHKADDVTQGDNPHGMIYEEGTWSPVWGTATFTLDYAKYIRQGNIVHCWLSLTLTSKGDATQTITGLPFVPKYLYTVGSIGQYGNINFNAGEVLYVRAFRTSSALQLFLARPNMGVTPITNTNLSDTSYITIYIAYEI